MNIDQNDSGLAWSYRLRQSEMIWKRREMIAVVGNCRLKLDQADDLFLQEPRLCRRIRVWQSEGTTAFGQ